MVLSTYLHANKMSKLDTGLSGCKLHLISSNVVRKESPSESYNGRLKLQARKQKLFSNYIFKNVETAKIIYMGDDYFDMQYMTGLSFDEFFSVSSINDIDFVYDSLCGYFDELIIKSQIYKPESSRRKILQKIKSLQPDTQYSSVLYDIEKHIHDNELKIPQSFCHGDLTFTNIIFHHNRLCFIDFLDCFIDSFLCDLIKLKQDLFYHWSLHNQSIKNLRVKQIYSFLWERLERRFSQYVDTIEFKILDVLNTLRIEPYLTNQKQRVIIERMINNSSLYGNISCSHGGKV